MDHIVNIIEQNILSLPQQPQSGKQFDESMIPEKLCAMMFYARQHIARTQSVESANKWYESQVQILAHKLGTTI